MTKFLSDQKAGALFIYADGVRVDWSYRLAMHVDTDEANAFSNEKEPYGVIVKFFDDNYNTDKWILKTYCPVLTAKCRGILCDSILLLFTGDIPQGVFVNRVNSNSIFLQQHVPVTAS